MSNKISSQNLIIGAAIFIVIAAAVLYQQNSKPDVSIDLPNGKSLTIDVDK